MNNKEHFKTLSKEQQAEFIRTYKLHPLANYIDWSAYFNSSDGNEMHFLRHLRSYNDEQGKLYYVLEETVVDDIDYERIYCMDDDEMLLVPVEVA